MKVTISTRQVYHKIVEVEVEVPNDLQPNEIGYWLIDNEEVYTDAIDQGMEFTDLEVGTGADENKWEDDAADSEWIYELTQTYKSHF